MSKKWTIISIIAVVIVAMMALGIRLKKDNDNAKESEKQEIILPKEEAQEETQEEENCITVIQDEECLTVIQQEDASGRESSVSDIEKTEINIVKMKEEVKKGITNWNAFVFAIQEYFYKTGIMETEVTCLNQITYDYNDNLIIYHMYVNSHVVTHFEVIYDITTESYKVLL